MASSVSSAAWTHEEDMQIWKYVIDRIDEPGSKKWNEFIEKTKSKRSDASVRNRFSKLLTHIPSTRFHMETKLKLCQQNIVEIDTNFLEELKKVAKVDVKYKMLQSFELKPCSEPNRDKDLDEDEFLGMMDPIASESPISRRFEPEEDRAIWQFALENCEQYPDKNGIHFWEGLVKKLNSDRTASGYKTRFNMSAKSLYLMDFSVEEKLKLYKCFRILVRKEAWEVLKRRAKLTMKGGRIISYEIKKVGRPPKRKNASGPSTSAAKKPRNSGEEEDRIYERTGANDPDMIEPNVEANVGAENEDEIQDVVNDNEGPRDAGGMGEEYVEQQEEVQKEERNEQQAQMTYSPRVAWLHDEDMNMWKFVIEDLDNQTPNKWEEFVEKTNSSRIPATVGSRFRNNVLPKLADTRFHVETKLKLCRKYNVKVKAEFLEELEKGAEVKLKGRSIESFQLKPDSEPNRDLDMDEDEFRGLMDPIVAPRNPFTEDEEREMWKFALENCEQYAENGPKFWQGLVTKLNSDRGHAAFYMKFNYCVKYLHKMNFPVEDKLKLYKCFQISVSETTIKMLKEHAVMKVEDGRIISYELKKNGRSQKRGNSSEPSTSAKKPRTSSDSDEEEEEPQEEVKAVQEDDGPEDIEPFVPEPRLELRTGPVVHNDDGQEDRGTMMKILEKIQEMEAKNEKRDKEQAAEMAKVVRSMEERSNIDEGFWKEMKEHSDRRDQKMEEMATAMSSMRKEITAVRREVNKDEPAPNFIDLVKSVTTSERPELAARVKCVEEKIGKLQESQKEQLAKHILMVAEATLEMMPMQK